MLNFRRLPAPRPVAEKKTARFGREGEEAAARHLRGLGWRILDRNWRGGPLELDLVCREGDTLVLDTDGSFIRTWGDSSVFLMLSNGKEYTPLCPPWKKWLALALLTLMIAGATFGSLPFVQRLLPDIRSDMFFWVAVVTVLMAAFGIFPAKKYTKFISWDILVTIASALAISRAMSNSGLADRIASHLIALSGNVSP